MMQTLLTAAVDDTIAVRSVGTLARGGDPMHPHSLQVLGERGIDGSDFQTTRLTESVVAEVDVVIAAAREHRAAAVSLAPRVVGRAFTLAELSRIAVTIDRNELTGSTQGERMMSLLPIAAARRGMNLPDDRNEDDLADPLGGPVEDFEACAGVIAGLLEPIVALLEPA
jgi:protein-tyrosine phosphatase